MQLGLGIIVAIIALAAAAGAAYYVQTTQHTATTTSPTQAPSTSIPVTTSIDATGTYSVSTTGSPTLPTHSEATTRTTSAATGTETGKTTTSPTETGSTTSTAPVTTTTTEETTGTSTTVTSPTTTTSTTTKITTTNTVTTTTTSTSTTQTATTHTTTTTTPEQATTTTATVTSTTTTTKPKEETLEPTVFHTYRELLQNYSHAKIHYKLVNGSETTELILSYKAGKTSNGYRVDINIARIENGETSSNNTITIFLDETMTTVTKIIMPGGQVYEGQMAQMAGQNILEALNHAIAMIAWVGDIKVAIAEGSYAATKAGWEVTSVEKTTATISGKTYNAYKISMLNKSDKDSDTTRAEFTLAEIGKDTWIAYRLHALQRDGSEFTWEITSLEP